MRYLVRRMEEFVPPRRRRPASGSRGGRPSAGPPRGGQRRAPGTRPAPPAAPGSTRDRAERRSALHLAYLHQLPRFVPFTVVAALVLVALFVSGPVGAVALALVAAFLLWLAYFSWPALTPGARGLRIVSIGVVLAAAVVTAGK